MFEDDNELTVTVNMTRIIIRDEFLSTIQNLQDEYEFSNKDILSEMLSIASAVLASSDTEINQVVISPFGNEEEEELSEEDLEYEESQNSVHEFLESDIHKKYAKLNDDYCKLYDLERFSEMVKIGSDIVDLAIHHATRYSCVVGENEDFPYRYLDGHNNLFFYGDMLKAYAALSDKSSILSLKERIMKVNDLYEIIDREVFEHECSKYLEDVDKMNLICEFLSTNPKFPQKKLYKHLSLNGPKIQYLLNWGEKMKRINRVRHNDTWLLTLLAGV